MDRRTFVGTLIVVVFLVSLSGCGRYYWSRSGTTAEQFSGDSRDCVQQATSSLPSGAAGNGDAIETLYRACLSARGYVRDKQFEPVPPGSHRGIESGEEFAAAARTAVATSRQSFEQELNQLDDLKARGRISEAEYAVMRQRLVGGVTPQALRPAAPAIIAAPAPPNQRSLGALPAALAELPGIWRGELSYRRSVLPGLSPLLRKPVTLRIYPDGNEVRWEMVYEDEQGREIRASGVVTVSDKQVTLTGRYDVNRALAGTVLEYVLTREGSAMSGSGATADRVVHALSVTRATQ